MVAALLLSDRAQAQESDAASDVEQASELQAFPSLVRAVSLARERAPEVQAAQAQVRVAKSGYRGARLFPIGNPSVELTADTPVTERDGSVALTGVMWLPVEIWGQRGKRVSEVDAHVSWRGSALDATRAYTASEAVRSYGTAVVESERLRLLDAILAVATDEAALYRARVQAGDATEQDAALAQVEVARNAVALAEARADLTRALTDLARVTGVTGYEPPPADLSAQPPAPTREAARVNELTDRSPHVRALQGEARYFGQARERIAAEARMPVSLMALGSRGQYGEYRVGAGLALTLPVLRTNQGEQAVFEAEQSRAMSQASAQKSATKATLLGLLRERKQVRAALSEMDASLEPAGQAAVNAAVEMQKAGKGELLHVLTARRDLAQLRARRLELLRREWQLLSQIVALTGELS